MFINTKMVVLLACCIYPLTVIQAQSPLDPDLNKKVESETRAVTVYLQGVKEKRTASAQVTAGEQQLLFTDLPQSLNPNTLRLGASDFVQIVSINHRLNYLAFDPDEDMEVRTVKDSLEYYNSQVRLKEGVYNSLQGTKQMILSNKTVKGETQGMEAEDLTDLLDFYREKLNEINIKSLALERQLETLRQRQAGFSREYNKMIRGKNKTYSELLVTIRSKQAGKVSFNIEYYTPAAGWNPQYDIRNNGNNGQLEITSYAQLWQATGYKWKNVDITLSTLDPQFDIAAPELQAQVLQLNPYVYNPAALGTVDPYYRMDQYGSRMDSMRVDDLEGSEKRQVIRGGSYKDISGYLGTSEKGPGTEYKIATPYTIESVKKETRIEINRKQVSAQFRYKTVPKVEKAVFLVAVVTGWDTLNYYPGNANIFNNGTFVGTMFLNTNSVEDSLQLSLGQDKSFSVEYEVLAEKTFTTNSGSSVKRGKGYTIKVMNKKDMAVTVEIMDQAPISTTQETVVTIDKNDATLDPVTGTLTWRKLIPPGQKTEIPISYSVKYPKDQILYNF